MEHKVSRRQTVGDVPLATSGSLAGSSFIELAVLCLFGLYAAIRNAFALFILCFDSSVVLFYWKNRQDSDSDSFTLFSLISCLLAQLSRMTTVQLKSFLILKGQIIVPL